MEKNSNILKRSIRKEDDPGTTLEQLLSIQNYILNTLNNTKDIREL